MSAQFLGNLKCFIILYTEINIIYLTKFQKIKKIYSVFVNFWAFSGEFGVFLIRLSLPSYEAISTRVDWIFLMAMSDVKWFLYTKYFLNMRFFCFAASLDLFLMKLEIYYVNCSSEEESHKTNFKHAPFPRTVIFKLEYKQRKFQLRNSAIRLQNLSLYRLAKILDRRWGTTSFWSTVKEISDVNKPSIKTVPTNLFPTPNQTLKFWVCWHSALILKLK